jgi:hypothetical protein
MEHGPSVPLGPLAATIIARRRVGVIMPHERVYGCDTGARIQQSASKGPPQGMQGEVGHACLGGASRW